ncbi:MAG: putative phosphatase [Acidimicrobiales bacterium]|nr:putative phosphatase [Acidimicrobiales bacterium]
MAWVLDLDGVVWRGDEPVAGAAAAVTRLLAAGEHVVYATNFSFSTVAQIEAKLAAMGVPLADVATSAMAAAGLVEPGERALLVAGPGVREALERRGVEVVTEGDADVVVVGWHRDFTYERMAVASDAVRAGARLLATNDDATFPTPDGLLPGAGAILAGIERASGVAAVVAGKPYPPTVADLLARCGPTGTMVGDRPDTDGRLARALGYRWALVLSGVTTAADLPVEPAPDVVAPSLASLVAEELGLAHEEPA